MEECMICKARMEFISETHCATHGLTRDEYKAKYGVNKVRDFRIAKTPTRNEAEQYEITRNKYRKSV